MNLTLPCSLRPFLALLVVGGTTSTVRAVEVSLSQCPPAVRAVVQKNLKGGRLDEIDRSASGRYFIEIDLPGRRDFDLLVTADGTVLRSEEDLPLARVPAKVRNTVRRQIPSGARLDDLEEVKTATRVSYRAEIDLRGEKDLYLLVSENGLVLKRSQRN